MYIYIHIYGVSCEGTANVCMVNGCECGFGCGLRMCECARPCACMCTCILIRAFISYPTRTHTHSSPSLWLPMRLSATMNGYMDARFELAQISHGEADSYDCLQNENENGFRFRSCYFRSLWLAKTKTKTKPRLVLVLGPYNQTGLRFVLQEKVTKMNFIFVFVLGYHKDWP